MEISAMDPSSLAVADWSSIINMPAYKLYIEVSRVCRQSNSSLRLSPRYRICDLILATISSMANIRELCICKSLIVTDEGAISSRGL